MNKIQMFKVGFTRVVGRSGLLLKKYSPEILTGVGIVGIVASTVMSCKATLKAEEILEEAKIKVDGIHIAKKAVDDGVISDEKYSDKDYKKDLLVTYIQTGVSFIKLYGPSATLGVLSIGCILGAHGIMRKRNLALVAAYKAVEQSFSDYRKRVVDELGTEKDRQFRYGTTKIEVTDMAYTDENGVEHPAKTVEVEVGLPSMYAKYYDKTCTQWTPDANYNLYYLKCQQDFMNDSLNAKGHVFLNEVYDVLGIPRTQPGSVVGWVKGFGDDYIDFGIHDLAVDEEIEEDRRDFVNGYKNTILLDFNVSGVIYDKI